MATHRISIMNNVLPDTSGNVYPERYTLRATNDVWQHLVWTYASAATRDGCYGIFDVPQNYVGTAQVVVVWSCATGAGNVVWDFDYRAVGGDDAESLDQAGTQESVSGTDAAPSASDERNVLTISLTSANFEAGDTVEFGIFRDGTDAADTSAVPAYLVDAYFQYADA